MYMCISSMTIPLHHLCKIVIKHAYLWSPRTAGVTFTVKDRHTCVSPVAYHALKHTKQVPLPNI